MSTILDQIHDLTTKMIKGNDESYYKEEIAQISPISSKHKFDFELSHIAICPNGGFMAFVKKSEVILMDSTNPLRSKIRIMTQNCEREYALPFASNKKDRSIVLFEFSDDEKLYCILSNGEIYRFKIIDQTYTAILPHLCFNNDKIIKAKLFREGFIALTQNGKFIIIEKMKESQTDLFYDLKEVLCDGSSILDFYLLPENITQSKMLELIFCCKDHPGMFIIVQRNENGTIIEEENKEMEVIKDKKKKDDQQKNSMKIAQRNILYFIQKDKKVVYNKKISEEIPTTNDIGFITSMAISPNNQIALYKQPNNSSPNIVFIYDSKFNLEFKLSFTESSYTKLKDKLSEERLDCLNFPLNSQFLWCSDQGVCICYKRLILFVTLSNNTYEFLIIEKKQKSDNLIQLMHCITEVDGIRILTQNKVLFISKVPECMYNSCHIISDAPAQKLIKVYENTTNNLPNCDSDLRNIRSDLSDAIKDLYSTAAEMWNTDIQALILKVVDFGKQYVMKGEFNFREFADKCIEMRIVNNLHWRNRIITYEEYIRIKTGRLIKLLLRFQQFFIANEICNELEHDPIQVYHKWAYCQIRNLQDNNKNITTDTQCYTNIMEKIKNVPNISYIKLAKKADKRRRKDLAMKFLAHETSIMAKIPVYIEMGELPEALKLCLETYDTNIIFTVFDKVYHSEDNYDNFIKKLTEAHKGIESFICEYLNKFQPEDYYTYLTSLQKYEEMFFFNLRKYFNLSSSKEQIIIITEMKAILSKAKSVKESSFDFKFYSSYANDLENQLKFKETELKKINIEDTSSNNSIHDIYESLINADRTDVIDKWNKEFEVSPRIYNLMKLKYHIDKGAKSYIENLIDNDMKKSGLSHIDIGQALYDGKKGIYIEKIVHALKMEHNLNYFDHKINILLVMKKYKDAIEAIIMEKEYEEKREKIDQVLRATSENLQNHVEEMCKKYKVEL